MHYSSHFICIVTMVIVVMTIITAPGTEAFKCYSCDVANAKHCTDNETTTCDTPKGCFTMSYKDKVKDQNYVTIKRPVFRKKCSELIKTSCQDLCKKFGSMFEDCKIDCCEGEKCNKNREADRRIADFAVNHATSHIMTKCHVLMFHVVSWLLYILVVV